MDGATPLSFQEIRAWAELVDIRIEPFEVQALIELDTVLRHPEAGLKDVEKQEEAAKPGPVWQKRAPGVEPQFVKKE